MRQNNETMLAGHTPHSTHCLNRLNSLNCLIKSVKTLQTVIKLAIVFLHGNHKLSNLICLDLSLTPNIAIIYCSSISTVNIHSSYLFTSLKFTGCPALVNCACIAQETLHGRFLFAILTGLSNKMNCKCVGRGGPSSPECVLCVRVHLSVCLCTHIWEGRAWPQLPKQSSVLPSLIRDISKIPIRGNYFI